MNDDLIWSVLNISITTSVVIGVLLILTPILQKRYTAKWRYFIWMAIALRLIVPINVTLNKPAFNIPVKAIEVSESMIPALPENISEPASLLDKTPLTTYPPKEEAASLPSWSFIFTTIWILGMAAFFLIQSITYCVFLRKVHYRAFYASQYTQLLLEEGKLLGLTKIPEIKICEIIPSPVLTGIFHPTILLPHGHFQEQELRFIIRHELIHYKRKDLWYKSVLNLAQVIHWFNPLVWIMNKQAGKDIELSCDDMVMKDFTKNDRGLYGEVILNNLPMKRKRGIDYMFTTSFGSTKKNMKLRIKNLFDSSVKKKGIAAFSGILLMTGMLSLLVGFTSVTAASKVPGSRQRNLLANKPITSTEYISFENVEVRIGNNGSAYIYDMMTYQAEQDIVGYEQCMLAFDKNGKPLSLKWSGFDKDSEGYYYVAAAKGEELGGTKEDGVWTLEGSWTIDGSTNPYDPKPIPPEVEEIEYVLYNLKQVTFSDGTVWNNPDYEKWLKQYKEKEVDIEELKGYYPYNMEIAIQDKKTVYTNGMEDKQIQVLYMIAENCNVVIEYSNDNNFYWTYNSDLFEITKKSDGKTLEFFMKTTENYDPVSSSIAEMEEKRIRIYIPEKEYKSITVVSDQSGIALPELNADLYLYNISGAMSMHIPEGFDKNIEYTGTNSSGAIRMSPKADNYTLIMDAEESAVSIPEEFPKYTPNSKWEYQKGNGNSKIQIDMKDSAFSVNEK